MFKSGRILLISGAERLTQSLLANRAKWCMTKRMLFIIVQLSNKTCRSGQSHVVVEIITATVAISPTLLASYAHPSEI